MRTVATGLLLATIVCYVATTLWKGAPGWVGYVRAAAEAGTVGALADWFAVTALFRHPLGLPIPHTAIVRKRKDELGQGLESFVSTHFLAEHVIRNKIISVGVARRVGSWLSRPADADRPSNADRVTDEIAARLTSVLSTMNDELAVDLIEKTVLPRLADWPWAPVLGAGLDRVVTDGLHEAVLDLVLIQAEKWLVNDPEMVRSIVREQAPAWSPNWVNEAVANRVHQEALRITRELLGDPDHRYRRNLEDFLRTFAQRLRTDPAVGAKVEEIKGWALAHPQTGPALTTMWATAKAILLDLSTDPDSDVRRQATRQLTAFGAQLATDPQVAETFDRAAVDLATRAVARYKGDIAAIIGDTIAGWEPAEAADRIELQVGRDLQFIRINGTVVGAIAGLLIHLVTALVL
jgi:uncharacterized membrane-anchored protein YjiN (DUF445 family)